jgi:hypothetical protein
MMRLVRVCAVLLCAILLSGGLGLRLQSAAPPILVVANPASSNPYGKYLAEIWTTNSGVTATSAVSFRIQ